jgi:transcriptional regulator with XRE-family HTH domain
MTTTVLAMKLRDLLEAHGISTIAEFRRRTGLSKQHAWNLWHGRANVGLHLARRLEERLAIPYTVFLELERERPPAARPPGRPRKAPKLEAAEPRPERFGWADGDLDYHPVNPQEEP